MRHLKDVDRSSMRCLSSKTGRSASLAKNYRPIEISESQRLKMMIN